MSLDAMLFLGQRSGVSNMFSMKPFILIFNGDQFFMWLHLLILVKNECTGASIDHLGIIEFLF